MSKRSPLGKLALAGKRKLVIASSGSAITRACYPWCFFEVLPLRRTQVQWASRKKRISYKFEFLRRSYRTHPQKFLFSRSLHRDTTMVISGTSYSTSLWVYFFDARLS
jgi:hypothetical protein